MAPFARTIAAGLMAACALAWAADSPSERLARLASERGGGYLDLSSAEAGAQSQPGSRDQAIEQPFTDEARERRRAQLRRIVEEAESIPAERLSPSERLTRELLISRGRNSLEALGFPLHQISLFTPLDGGVANDLIRLVGRQPFRRASDYDAWLKRMKRYPAVLDGVTAVLRRGMQAGITIPKPLVERALGQLDALDPWVITRSPLWRPVDVFPASMDAAARERFEKDYRAVLGDEVLPAVKRLGRFVRDEYLPHARTTAGIDALPNGAAMYRHLVRASTTTSLTPEEIHEIGLKEVKRIQAELLAAGKKAGFGGPVSALPAWLAANPRAFPFSSANDVLEHLRTLEARIVPKLPLLFGRLPKTPLEIRLTDAALAGTVPAQWYPPSEDGSRPGVFAMPVVDARKRSSVGFMSLLLHEGVPGHHLDGSLKLESKLPPFRRRLFINAYAEGWALYAEYLGHEMGLYDDPLDLLGRYRDELYRAGRLVADTGIHAKGWTREQAVRYMTQECGLSHGAADFEVLRYMAWPAQALGYKIGELAIRDIRTRAEARLGTAFDVRAFHDAVLAEGHLPLDMLRARMENWPDHLTMGSPGG